VNRDGQCLLISGALGSGKTLCAVERILKHLALGGTVVTNIPLSYEAVALCLRRRFRVIFQPSRLRLISPESLRSFQDFAVRGNSFLPAMLVLDEAALDINARDWRSRDDMAFDLVVLARKLGILLVFVAQDQEDLDSQIRRKFQQEICCRSLANLWERDDGRQIGIPVFVRVRVSNKLGKLRGSPPPRLGWTIQWRSFAFGCFDSHALHGSRAKVFGALEQAAEGSLERVPFDSKPLLALVAGLSLAILSL